MFVNATGIRTRKGLRPQRGLKGRGAQAKGFRFMMSHETGKIEILGCMDDAADEGSAASMLFKYHQARDRSNLGKLFTVALPADACWL